MSNFDRLSAICYSSLESKGLLSDKNNSRLKYELLELKKCGEEAVCYLLNLYDKKAKASENENNLLITYLLDICDFIDLEHEAEHTIPEMLDIDVDYIPKIRDYLKTEYTPKEFGVEKTCNIAVYGTYGIKSSMIDMTRIFGGDRQEVLALTKKIEMKDEEGETMSWDSALSMYPDLKKWSEKYPEIYQAARKLTHADIDWDLFDFKDPPHRVRNIGTHAGGVVIADRRIDEYVPIIRGKDGVRQSAWQEGQNAQELSLFGFTKFDYLVIDALEKIALAIKFIRERHPGINKICAIPGGRNFSDESYLNDPKVLKYASKGDLNMIFQFDSSGIRELAKKCRVDKFEDMVALSALYRPSTMQVGMHEEYVNRKHGLSQYDIPEILKADLARTYGILVYQESVMSVLHKVGNIPLRECQPIIKAISKKKIEKFAKYKDQFIKNGQQTIGYSEEQMSAFWDQIESFAGYGFNRCLAPEVKVYDPIAEKFYTVEEIVRLEGKGIHVRSYDVKNGVFHARPVTAVFSNGEKPILRMKTEKGRILLATHTHKIFTRNGWYPMGGLELGEEIGSYSSSGTLEWDKVKELGFERIGKTYDITVDEDHNFVAENIIVHNSHAVGYTILSMRQLWLKTYYPVEYICAVFHHMKTGDDRFPEYRADAERHGISILPVDINKSKDSFNIESNDEIRWGFSFLKGIGEDAAKKVVQHQPYVNFADFLNKHGTDQSVTKPLIGVRCFPENSEPKEQWAFYHKFKDFVSKRESIKLSMQNSLNKLERLTGIACELNQALATYEKFSDIPKVSSSLKILNKQIDRFSELLSSMQQPAILPEEEQSTAELLNDRNESSIAYYGFMWNHPVSDCPKTRPELVFALQGEGDVWVDVFVVDVLQKKSKNSNNYTQLIVEDRDSTTKAVNIWSNDVALFGDYLSKGAILRMELNPPSNGFPTYSLKNRPRYQKSKPRELDERIIVLKPGNIDDANG